jgi:hypothetical protein
VRSLISFIVVGLGQECLNKMIDGEVMNQSVALALTVIVGLVCRRLEAFLDARKV